MAEFQPRRHSRGLRTRTPERTRQPPAIADHERQPAFECFEASTVSPFVTSDILDLIPAIAIPGYERYFPYLASREQLGGLVNENHQIHRFGNERLRAANLADHDSRRFQSHARAKTSQHRDASNREQIDLVADVALEFGRIL